MLYIKVSLEPVPATKDQDTNATDPHLLKAVGGGFCVFSDINSEKIELFYYAEDVLTNIFFLFQCSCNYDLNEIVMHSLSVHFSIFFSLSVSD